MYLVALRVRPDPSARGPLPAEAVEHLLDEHLTREALAQHHRIVRREDQLAVVYFVSARSQRSADVLAARVLGSLSLHLSDELGWLVDPAGR